MPGTNQRLETPGLKCPENGRSVQQLEPYDEPTLSGDVVVVFGLGALGLLADVATEFPGSYAALHGAIRSVRVAGLVVAGFYQGGGAALRLGEEWHHHRVTMVSSQRGRGNAHRDAPPGTGRGSGGRRRSCSGAARSR